MSWADPGWEVAVAAGAELGERPFWDPADGCLLWVDINAGRLHRYRPGAGDEVVLELADGGRAVGTKLAPGPVFEAVGSKEVRYDWPGPPPTPGSTTARATPRGGSGPAR